MKEEYKGKIVFWPINIDSTVSIRKGRKIPLDAAVKNPRLQEVIEAAQKLGLNPEVERKSYPRNWWSQTARIVVDKKWSKRETLKRISMEIKRRRGT
ncbi:MAG: signal recognition particle protein Srp19 [Desulfurococcales archaeon]|nr:signal recognition particle protein Srp19 [Desulfurococcales archaeon]